MDPRSGFMDHLWKSCSKSDPAVGAEFNTEAALMLAAASERDSA